ncbi:MAG: hypothetical protein DRQ48_09455, partial [Gammaproteobacteria bacterium]
SSTMGSQAGDLTLQESGGGTEWDIIPVSPIGEAQSTLGVFTVPAGKKAYLLSGNVFVDSNKDADLIFFQRPNADDVTSPYSGARRIVSKFLAISGGFHISRRSPAGSFTGPCDLGFMGRGNGATADVSVDFEILLVDE